MQNKRTQRKRKGSERAKQSNKEEHKNERDNGEEMKANDEDGKKRVNSSALGFVVYESLPLGGMQGEIGLKLFYAIVYESVYFPSTYRHKVKYAGFGFLRIFSSSNWKGATQENPTLRSLAKTV